MEGAFRATLARFAGGHMKYRTLGRDSAHRQALLRNLATSVIKQESIQTTWAKAKEAQRVVDKLITLAKRNNETARRSAQAILYVCVSYVKHAVGSEGIHKKKRNMNSADRPADTR